MNWFVRRMTALQSHRGERIPHGYGLAWYEDHIAEAVLMPIPLNVLAGWLRALYHGLIAGVRPSVLDRAHREGWDEARRYNHGEMRLQVLKELDQEHREMEIRVLADLRREVSALRSDIH